MTGPELKAALDHASAACIAGNELHETIACFAEFLDSLTIPGVSMEWVAARHADAMNEHWEQLI